MGSFSRVVYGPGQRVTGRHGCRCGRSDECGTKAGGPVGCPTVAGGDTAGKLVGSVLQWARSGSVERVKLWVTDGKASAQRLYQRFGFEETGVGKPLPSN